jgi:hypothetical protein
MIGKHKTLMKIFAQREAEHLSIIIRLAVARTESAFHQNIININSGDSTSPDDDSQTQKGEAAAT